MIRDFSYTEIYCILNKIWLLISPPILVVMNKMGIIMSFYPIHDAFNKVTPVLKNQLIRIKFQCRTNAKSQNCRTVCALSYECFVPDIIPAPECKSQKPTKNLYQTLHRCIRVYKILCIWVQSTERANRNTAENRKFQQYDNRRDYRWRNEVFRRTPWSDNSIEG